MSTDLDKYYYISSPAQLIKLVMIIRWENWGLGKTYTKVNS